MKKPGLTAGLLLIFAAFCSGQNRDTVFIKRPYYLGVTAAYTKFNENAVRGNPFNMSQLPQSNEFYQQLFDEKAIGLELAFPFLRKWECETDFEYVQTSGWQQSCVYYKKTNPQPEQIFWSATSHNVILHDWRLRSFFSYEVMSSLNSSIHAGAGAWYSSFPRIGGEAGAKMYYRINSGFSIQGGAYVGYSAITKVYVSARFSLLLSGTRTYRARPDHYYVRTYED